MTEKNDIMIYSFKYDPAKQKYTDEIEQMTLREFVYWFCNRNLGSRNNVLLGDLLQYADKQNIPYDGKTKREVSRQVFDNMSDDDLLAFCDEFGIGVQKWNYIAAGMTESEYQRAIGDLTVIRKEYINWSAFRNLYSIREYIDFCGGIRN